MVVLEEQQGVMITSQRVSMAHRYECHLRCCALLIDALLHWFIHEGGRFVQHCEDGVIRSIHGEGNRSTYLECVTSLQWESIPYVAGG